LISRTPLVARETLYVNIDLVVPGVSPFTGIFIPDGYHEPSQIDLIVWLMGHHNNDQYPPNLTIGRYWQEYRHFMFREFVLASHKNVVLVAPTLGPHSDSGKLIEQGGFAWYLDQILAALREYAGFASDTPLGDLIVACHSGGGAPMLKIATTPQKYLDNVKQYWGFDSLYGDGAPGAWSKWASGNGGKKLRIRYGNGGTADHSRTLQTLVGNLSNVDVDGSESTSHNLVPTTYWNKFMRDAHFLLDT
jgi:hypothetical protein